MDENTRYYMISFSFINDQEFFVMIIFHGNTQRFKGIMRHIVTDKWHKNIKVQNSNTISYLHYIKYQLLNQLTVTNDKLMNYKFTCSYLTRMCLKVISINSLC